MRQLLRLIAAGVAAGVAAGGACSGDEESFDRGDEQIRFEPLRPRSTPASIDIRMIACAESLLATATIRETAAIAPEGLRPRPKAQDQGWVPTRLADLAVSRDRFAVVDQGGRTLTVFAPDFASRTARERPGSGPGEFRSPVAVSAGSSAEPVWVLDDRRSVAMAFSGAAEFIREVAVVPSGTDLALDADGTLYVAHQVLTGPLLSRAGDSVVVVSRYQPDGTPMAPLLTLHRSALIPPRFVLPAVTEVRLAASGARVAVFYPAGGVIDVFDGGRYRASAQVCVPPELAEAYARQRRSTEPRQSWVALITDVRFDIDGAFAAVSHLPDRRGRFLVHQFGADGKAAGSVAIENPGITMPSEVRFGPVPEQLVAFSPESGIIAVLTMGRR